MELEHPQSSGLRRGRDKIILNDIGVQAIIGVNTGERRKKQNIIINITAFVDVSKCGKTDDIHDTVDYSLMTKRIISHVESAQPFTLEALTTAIARIVCVEFLIEEVIVRVDKPSAMYLVKSPAVEIVRTRDFFLREQEREVEEKNASKKRKLERSQSLDADGGNTNNTTGGSLEPGHVVYLAVGSNVGNRLQNIHEGLKALGEFCKIESTSFLYETPPAYVLDQPSFLNAAVKAITDLSPVDLLKALKATENQLGRQKTIRFGPRSIDLDIIFYDNVSLNIPGPDELIIPHPRVHERDFVLGPLMDIAPNYVHPVSKKTIRELYSILENVSLKKILPFKESLFALGEKTLIMGILNVTPDSFSDGGKFLHVEKAVEQCKRLVKSGAHIIDIGGQSTRPGAQLISLEEELSRVIPVIHAIRKELNVPLSIDTFYSKVAKEAIQAGADMVNDVSCGNFDPLMFSTCAQLQVPLVIVHSKGTPQTMSTLASYENLIEEVKKTLEEKTQLAQSNGVYRWNLLVDPGIGFAKHKKHSLQLLREGSALNQLKFPTVYGSSRKGFIGEITKRSEPSERVWGTAATCVAAIQQGADILRIHDVEELKNFCLYPSERPAAECAGY